MFFFNEEPVVNNMNRTNLEYVKLNGLFGCYNVELKLCNEVNVYIGENGLGKTTILNCVYYILKQRYIKLAEIDFSEICVKFLHERKEYNLTMSDINAYNEKRMSRQSNFSDDDIKFVIQDLLTNNSIKFNSIDDNELEIVTMRLSRISNIPLISAKKLIRQYLQTGEVNFIKDIKKGDHKKVEELNSVIEKYITQDVLYLTTYRRIEDDLSNLLNKEDKYRDDMLIRFGMSDVDKMIDSTLNLIRQNSIESFNKMTGVLLKQYAQPKKNKFDSNSIITIDNIMLKIILDRLGKEIAVEDKENIISLLDSGKIFDIEYAYLFDLIVKLIESYDKQKDYDDKIKKFVTTCNKYLNGKKFVYNQSDLSLEVELYNNNNKVKPDTIKLMNLSSGEKQIVSLFSKLYLDNEKDRILIIDEPELSLSMGWQQMLLPDIMRSGNCKLLLTVTHSPFIFDNEFDSDAKEMRKYITNHISGVNK